MNISPSENSVNFKSLTRSACDEYLKNQPKKRKNIKTAFDFVQQQAQNKTFHVDFDKQTNKYYVCTCTREFGFDDKRQLWFEKINKKSVDNIKYSDIEKAVQSAERYEKQMAYDENSKFIPAVGDNHKFYIYTTDCSFGYDADKKLNCMIKYRIPIDTQIYNRPQEAAKKAESLSEKFIDNKTEREKLLDWCV